MVRNHAPRVIRDEVRAYLEREFSRDIMKDYKITTTGRVYDFARTVENLTDRPLYFTLDEENTDAEFDEEGNLISGNIAYRECDKEDAEDYSDSFVIPANDWVGLAYNEIIC